MAILKREVIGNQTLLLGDCLQVMPLLGRFDAVVTDPPYGIGFGSKHTSHSRNRGTKLSNFDAEIPDVAPVLEMADECIIWGGERFNLPVRRRWLTWVKPDAAPTFASTEFAWTSKDAPAKFFVHAVGAMNRDRVPHPTQKPLPLMEWCLGFLPDAKTILDPFMGSGTTLVACQRMGRYGTGIELDEDYWRIACERVHGAWQQPDLLIPETRHAPVQEGFDL